jgi:hypothetical protein
MHWLLLSSGMWRRVVCRPLPTALRRLLSPPREMEFAIYSALLREQCVKLVSFANTSVYSRASVLVAVRAAMMRPSNQKDQPGVQEQSALSVLNVSLSQMVIICEIRRRKCVPKFGVPVVLKVRSQVFFTFLSGSSENELHLYRRLLHVSTYM